MQQTTEEFVQDAKELKQRLIENLSKAEYTDTVDNITEYSTKNGLLFKCITNIDNYIFDFGDKQYQCNEEFINGLADLFKPKEKEA